MDEMNLNEELQLFDGIHVGPLEAVAARLLARESGIDELIALSSCTEADVQVGATWILKWLHERHVQFSEKQTKAILRSVREATRWETRLHLLQLIDGLEIPSSCRVELYKALRGYLCDESKLVRAWSYNALFVLGDQHARYRRPVTALLVEAADDPAASVRARVRNIFKKSGWAGSSV